MSHTTRIRVVCRCATLGLAAFLARALVADPATAQETAKATFEKLCSPCHGMTGGGDGPAARALTTKPMDFSDTASVASKTDNDLIKLIAEGNPPMPAFGKQLSASQIKALVAYVRDLGKPR